MTFKELVKLLFSFFWRCSWALPLALHYSGRDCQVLWGTVFGGGPTEGAKNIRGHQDPGRHAWPTQFGIHDDAVEAERAEVPEPGITTELAHFVKGEKGDADIMSDLSWLHPKKEGGLKYGPEVGLGDLSEIIGKDEPLP